MVQMKRKSPSTSSSKFKTTTSLPLLYPQLRIHFFLVFASLFLIPPKGYKPLCLATFKYLTCIIFASYIFIFISLFQRIFHIFIYFLYTLCRFSMGKHNHVLPTKKEKIKGFIYQINDHERAHIKSFWLIMHYESMIIF